MTGRTPSWLAITRSEVVKLASRTSVRLALVSMGLIAILAPILMFVLEGRFGAAAVEAAQAHPDAQVTAITFTLGQALGLVLAVRNFFVFRAMIIAVVAVSFAGELASRTLREDLVRPVSRGSVLAAKWAALQVFVLLGVLIPLVLGGLVGGLFFEVDGLKDALLSFALTAAGDVGFSTLVMALSLLLRSVVGTVGGVFLYWVLDKALGLALWTVGALRPFIEANAKERHLENMLVWVDRTIALRAWLPSTAFDLYGEVSAKAAFPWTSAAALVCITLLSGAVAFARIRTMDID